MKLTQRFLNNAVALAIATLSVGIACAGTTPPPAPAATAPATAAPTPAPTPAPGPEAGKPLSRKEMIAAQRKANATVKPVDINNASAEALQKVPGISEEVAKKIIANRPYGSKAWLVTKKIISQGEYEGMKRQIIAKQPYKTVEKNAAIYEKKK